MASKKILVTGATGKQGRALITALRPESSQENEETSVTPFQILGLTRDASTASAKSLDAEPHVTVVQGDLDSEQSVRKVFEDAGGKGAVWGVFAVLAYPGLGASGDGVERQGKLLADLALEFGVSHFVYSSAERGGEQYDDETKLDRLAKVRIERHVRSLEERGLKWTILRPGFFMENFDGTIGKITATVMRCGLQPDTKLQLVSADDIGRVAAAVFNNSNAAISKILVLVGEALTYSEQDAAYLRGTGKHLPSIPNILGRILIAMNGATKDLISDMERVHKLRVDDPAGYTAHLADARAIYPHMTTFEEWARERKNIATQQAPNWNQVSILKLITGRH
ncbi:NAD(P)-binding protein [Cristinia sonorae]|uniref:NAD(P)-binding protein n=1 Tax=Cristinia sonorae TaxID=1940300 RepID=A0A8K0UQQ7_9AGAR|nr:NAD(P)-binding protein [Cristinia sonorae]